MSDEQRKPDHVLCFSPNQVNVALAQYAGNHKLIRGGVYSMDLDVVSTDPLVLRQKLWREPDPPPPPEEEPEPVTKPLRWYWPW